MSSKSTLAAEGYTWSQTDSAVSFQFFVPPHVSQDAIVVNFTSNTLSAGVIDETNIIKGKLYASINTTTSTWEFKQDLLKNVVRIKLSKDAKGSQWPVAITGGLKLRQDADPTSTFLLGQLTEGVLPHKTMELYRRSAQAGHIPAQLRLGEIFELGQSQMVMEPDPIQALHWYRQAAELGSIEAIMFCANTYFLGKGTDIDYNKSLNFYCDIIEYCQKESLKLFSEVNLKAISELQASYILNTFPTWSKLYITSYHQAGRILTSQEEYPGAFELFKSAAQLNHPASLFQLALLYLNGLGVSSNNQLALQYFIRAQALDANLIPPIDLSSLKISESVPSSPPDTPTPTLDLSHDKNALSSKDHIDSKPPSKLSSVSSEVVSKISELSDKSTSDSETRKQFDTENNSRLPQIISAGALVVVVAAIGFVAWRRSNS